jgi:tyrosine-specific transport protein
VTGVFAVSGAALFAVGAPHADWARLATPCHWPAAAHAIPTFLQLLVYGEILPSVCALLQHQLPALRKAVVVGSLLPLLVEVAWAALGVGLTVPPGPAAAAAAGSAAAGAAAAVAAVVDPVDVLLATRGPVQLPLLCLAAAAVSTTVVGSYLALGNALSDWLTRPPSTDADAATATAAAASNGAGRRVAAGASSAEADAPRLGQQRRLLIAAMSVLPPLLVACSSPGVFLAAIDFAGSYPVLLLWGVAPPCMALRLRWKQRRTLPLLLQGQPGQRNDSTSTGGAQDSSGSDAWLVCLAAVSAALVLTSAIPDARAALTGAAALWAKTVTR